MTASQAGYFNIQEFTDAGLLLVGGRVYTYTSGTTTQKVAYTDAAGTVPQTYTSDGLGGQYIALNARGELPAPLFLTTGAYDITLKRADGTTVWTRYARGGDDAANAALATLAAPTGAAGIGYGNRTVAARLDDAVSVMNYAGIDATGTTDSTAAIQAATNSGKTVYFPDGQFKVLGVISYAGTVRWVGNGSKTTILCDGKFLDVTNGSGSFISTINLQNITAPWVITRDPTNWTANRLSSLIQSSTTLGYQPTNSDPEYTSMTSAQQNSYIGPQMLFHGDSEGIVVEKITGRFVLVTIQDSSASVVRDCRFRGGHHLYGAICFDNFTNGVKVGVANKAHDNVISYSSNNGVVYLNNTDGEAHANIVFGCGESGVKTYQGTGTICYRMKFDANRAYWNYFDGIDALSSFPTTDTYLTYHHIVGNYLFNNGGDGLNIDGQFNTVDNNFIYFNSRYGIFGAMSNTDITNNKFINNNTARVSTQHEVILNGAGGNVVDSNRFWGAAGQNNFSIFCAGSALNYITDNIATGAAGAIFAGNPGAIASTVQNNSDPVSGPVTDQSFSVNLINSGGIQGLITSDPGNGATGIYSSRIIGATGALTAVPSGADASTAFGTGGLKIGSAATNALWLNTGPQVSVNSLMIASISSNTTGTPLFVQAITASININGVTRNRLALLFFNATTGAAFNLTAMNGQLGVQFNGKLA